MANTKHILKTKRLLLREFHTSDGQSFFDLNNDPKVMRYTGDLPFESLEHSKKFIENYGAYHEFGFGRWTVLHKQTGTCLGWCGLKRHSDQSVDLGYRFHAKHWGKGYATEAALACVDYGFRTLKLNEIIGRTARANTASIRVLEKAGMTYWKSAPCEGITDAVYYRITRNDHKH